MKGSLGAVAAGILLVLWALASLWTPWDTTDGDGGRVTDGSLGGSAGATGSGTARTPAVRLGAESSSGAVMDGGAQAGAGPHAGLRSRRHDAGRAPGSFTYGPSKRENGNAVAAAGRYPAKRDQEGGDPQRHLSARTLARAGVDPADTFGEVAWRGRVVESDALDLDPGTTCEVRALPALAQAFNCMLRVRCGGRTVYPNEEEAGGFVLCWPKNERPTRLVDDRPTPLDGDPAIELDLEAREVTLTDAADEGPSPYLRVRLDA